MDSLAKLAPAQVRELREGFQNLDRDSDGVVGRDDVVDMLTQLGMPNIRFLQFRKCRIFRVTLTFDQVCHLAPQIRHPSFLQALHNP